MLEILEKRGFGHTWISWIRKILLCSSIGVHINNCDGDFCTTWEGLRVCDPLSSILFNFNLVVDILTRMLIKAVNHNMI